MAEVCARVHTMRAALSLHSDRTWAAPGRRCIERGGASSGARTLLGGWRGRTESKHAPPKTQERVRLVLVDNEDGDDVSII